MRMGTSRFRPVRVQRILKEFSQRAMSQMRSIAKRSLLRVWVVKQRSNQSDGFQRKAFIKAKNQAGVAVLLTLSSRS